MSLKRIKAWFLKVFTSAKEEIDEAIEEVRDEFIEENFEHVPHILAEYTAEDLAKDWNITLANAQRLLDAFWADKPDGNRPA